MGGEIQIRSGSLAAGELRRAVSEHVPGAAVQFEVREPASDYRVGIDATVVVAVVSGSASVLSALITGIFSLMAARRSGSANIVIRSADGRSIEFPADTSAEEIPRLVELTRQLDRPSIELP
ncbi:hypothetical protein ACI1MP_31055 [Kitasatospora griseola]|uniref:effector-associated constant component EACC1 n=1 Tax=Kitasatospora griseola TaxID=2064 RepID=UPI003855D9FE